MSGAPFVVQISPSHLLPVLHILEAWGCLGSLGLRGFEYLGLLGAI